MQPVVLDAIPYSLRGIIGPLNKGFRQFNTRLPPRKEENCPTFDDCRSVKQLKPISIACFNSVEAIQRGGHHERDRAIDCIAIWPS
jgi:hypothetical protein